jgi:hypothetical protein
LRSEIFEFMVVLISLDHTCVSILYSLWINPFVRASSFPSTDKLPSRCTTHV